MSNLLTEILFESALARAQELDAHFQSTGTTVGPLHGVPVSIKDNFNIAGVDSSVGFLSPPFAHAPAAADSLVVQILRNAGALILCKTNIPQLMMSLEPVNPLWGRSTNPHNRALITGGSSSGEGGLVASRGSVLGIGTDIGGSIRGPGAFNGVCELLGRGGSKSNLLTGIFLPFLLFVKDALKPTSQRVPLLGAMTLIGGQESVRSVAGPLCSSVADIDLSMSVILAANPWESDPALLNVAWRRNMIEEPKGRKLRVGYFTNNGFYTTSPPVARAIGETVAALRAAGHECIEIQPPCVGELQAMSVQIFNSHGYIRLHEFIEKTGDPLEKFTAYQRSFATMSKSQLLQRAEKALKKYADDKVFQEQVLAGARGALSADEVYRLNIRRNEISKLWSDMWKEKNLDCVVCEVIALPAVPAGTFNEAAFAGTGTVSCPPYQSIPRQPLTYDQPWLFM